MKTCNRCKIEKIESEFNKNSSSKDGLRNYCRECQKNMSDNYHQNNSDLIKKRKKEWYENNTEKIKNSRKKSYERHGKQIAKLKYEKYKNNSVEYLKLLMRSRIRKITKILSIKKHKTSMEIVGCTPLELKNHLEKQFTLGMSWDNQGKWHIDHIIPLSSAKNEDDVYKLCHYSNLQPLWAIDNIKKGSKTPF
jgi:hypothetical protein